ncbi:MAG: PHP domain-containing protein [Acidimicrobiaceae bacterium]|nr:PHP domain-containing protein [Acidimicrobiaceae bacterium]
MIDLHLHSNRSDGSDSPTELIRIAHNQGCTTVAVSDHDTLDGIDEAKIAAQGLGVRLIPAIEVSLDWNRTSIHALAYFVENDSQLALELGELKRLRATRNDRLIELIQSHGIPITKDMVRLKAGSNLIARPHFAAVLVDLEIATSIQDAFDRYLGDGGAFYISKEKLTPERFISLANASSAITSIAHPFRNIISKEQVKDMIVELGALGFDSIESYYSEYDQKRQNWLASLASDLSMTPTGGSDYHGKFKPGLLPGVGRGDLVVPEEVIELMLERRRNKFGV